MGGKASVLYVVVLTFGYWELKVPSTTGYGEPVMDLPGTGAGLKTVLLY